MTDKTRKRLGLLGVLVGVFVAVMFVVSRGEGPAGPSASPSNQASRPGVSTGASEVADVNLEVLKRTADEPAAPERNLFAFEQKAPPPRPPREASSPSPAVEAPPVPAGPPPPPPIQLKFIGVLESAATRGKVAILSDDRGNTFHAREGEDIDGRYRVLRIGTDSIEMSYVDGRGRQTLRLSGQ